MDKRVYLCLAHMSGREEAFIREAFATNWVAPLGPNVQAFEEALERYLGNGKRVVALSSGTAAIHLGLLLLGVGPGDEVICQSFTFCASANPAVYLGATPVFVESEAQTWNMDPARLETAILDRIARGRKPKAIVAVHLYGMPARIDALCRVADRYGIPLLEDAAEALGSEFGGRKCGTFGTLGALSFNGNKMITTSGGGALILPDEATKRRAVFFATQAREPAPHYEHERIGYNYRMSNICAGIGRGQMTVLDDHIAHHRRLHSLYAEAFSDLPGISLADNPDSRWASNFWLCTLLVDPAASGTGSGELRHRLEAANIESRPLWKPLHLQPVFARAPRYVDGTCEALFARGLCLPAGPQVSDDDVARIVACVRSCVRKPGA